MADNLLSRQFSHDRINQAWVSDITYIRTSEGWLYLAAVMDLASRRIVGRSMSDTMDTALIAAALRSAVASRKPEHGLIVHSDRGCQYASHSYRDLIGSQGFRQSMSRKGNCWDNAPMESFFHSLKVEWLYGSRYETRAEAQAPVFEYIEVWYNRKRLHSTLDYMSPANYEFKLAA